MKTVKEGQRRTKKVEEEAQSQRSSKKVKEGERSLNKICNGKKVQRRW